MRVYSTVIFDLATSELITAESERYDGPVCECKGGKGSTAVPEAPAPPKEPVTPKSQIDALRALRTTTAEKRKKAAAAGATTGVVTSPLGLTAPAATTTKKLLGE